MVSNIPYFDAGFFPHLALDRILKGFSWLHEAGQSGVELPRELFLFDDKELAAESTAIQSSETRTFLPSRAFSPDSSMASMITTGSVLGCAKLCKPVLQACIIESEPGMSQSAWERLTVWDKAFCRCYRPKGGAMSMIVSSQPRLNTWASHKPDKTCFSDSSPPYFGPRQRRQH